MLERIRAEKEKYTDGRFRIETDLQRKKIDVFLQNKPLLSIVVSDVMQEGMGKHEEISTVKVYDVGALSQHREELELLIHQQLNSESYPRILAMFFVLLRFVSYRGYKRPKNSSEEFYLILEKVLGEKREAIFDPCRHFKMTHVPSVLNRAGDTSRPLENLVVDYAYKGFTTEYFPPEYPQIMIGILQALVLNEQDKTFRNLVQHIMSENHRDGYLTHPDLYTALVGYYGKDKIGVASPDEIYSWIIRDAHDQTFVEYLYQFRKNSPVFTTSFPGRYQAELQHLIESGRIPPVQAIAEIGSGEHCYVVQNIVKPMSANVTSVSVGVIDPAVRPNLNDIPLVNASDSLAVQAGVDRNGLLGIPEFYQWMLAHSANLALIISNVTQPHIADDFSVMRDIFSCHPKVIVVVGGLFDSCSGKEALDGFSGFRVFVRRDESGGKRFFFNEYVY